MGLSDHQDLDAAARRVCGVIERLAREGTAVARSDGTRHDLFPVAASAAEGEALRGWVVRERATRTVEVGLGYAVSALHVCEGLLRGAGPATGPVAMDPFQATRFSGRGLQFLEEAGVLGMVEHLAERSGAALTGPRCLSGPRSLFRAFRRLRDEILYLFGTLSQDTTYVAVGRD